MEAGHTTLIRQSQFKVSKKIVRQNRLSVIVGQQSWSIFVVCLSAPLKLGILHKPVVKFSGSFGTGAFIIPRVLFTDR